MKLNGVDIDYAGPDYRQTVSITVGSFKLRFHAAVLHLRGDHVAKQPFRTDQYILIYVGTAYLLDL